MRKNSKSTYGEGSFRMVRGKWNYRFRYKDVYGDSRQKSVTAPTKEECYAKAEEFLEDLQKKIENPNIDVTIPDLLKYKFDTDHKMNYTGEVAYFRNLQFLKIWERHGIAKVPIRKITPRQLEVFLQSITVYSDSVIMKLYQQLRAAYRMAIDDGIVKKNLVNDRIIRRPKAKKHKKKVRALTREEQRRFEEALQEVKLRYGTDDYRLQMRIALHSGLRIGEVNALRPEDIDFERNVIHVRSTITLDKEGKPYVKDGTKTENGIRDVPISKALRPALEEALAAAAAKPENPYGVLFYSTKRKTLITTTRVSMQYKRVLKEAGIEERGAHSLRHTFATRCIESGVPAVVLKNWLGHSDIHMTLDIYADVFKEMHNDAIEKLDRYMGRE